MEPREIGKVGRFWGGCTAPRRMRLGATLCLLWLWGHTVAAGLLSLQPLLPQTCPKQGQSQHHVGCLVTHCPMSTAALSSSMVTELLLFHLSRTSWHHPSFTSAWTQNRKGGREMRDLPPSWLPHLDQMIDVTWPGRVAAATVTMDLRSHSPGSAPSTQPYHAHAECRKQSVVSNGLMCHELV